ncbi:MAG: (2Fe-2S)-binding domain protein, partial [Tardiphaga sp.]|nr:(2Fe-2S)-binding domain protein [Tardiphaga sp.]
MKPDEQPALEQVRLTVNGTLFERYVEPRRHLGDFLRQDLHLTGTHIGCEHGVCGTCTVLLNGASIRSCITLAVQAVGAEISTVEGLARNGELHPLQDEFSAKQGLQCGYCTPG